MNKEKFECALMEKMIAAYNKFYIPYDDSCRANPQEAYQDTVARAEWAVCKKLLLQSWEGEFD